MTHILIKCMKYRYIHGADTNEMNGADTIEKSTLVTSELMCLMLAK